MDECNETVCMYYVLEYLIKMLKRVKNPSVSDATLGYKPYLFIGGGIRWFPRFVVVGKETCKFSKKLSCMDFY